MSIIEAGAKCAPPFLGLRNSTEYLESPYTKNIRDTEINSISVQNVRDFQYLLFRYEKQK